MDKYTNYFQQNVDLWQRFSDSYVENLTAAFEKNLEQTKTLQDQFYKVTAGVLDSQFKLAMRGLEILDNQTSKLENSIDEFVTSTEAQ